MPFETRLLSKEECHDVALLAFESWADNDFRKATFPPSMPDHTINEMVEKFGKAINEPDQNPLMVVDTDTKEVIAYCIWSYTPERSHEQWIKERDERMNHWPGANWDLCLPMFADDAAG